MLLPFYAVDELSFSFRCYVYIRWHTYRRQKISALKRLTPGDFETEHPEIHILELNASNTDIALMASLRPTDSVSTAASKLKGAASIAIRRIQNINESARIMGGGYFAATVGANTTDELDHYLNRQGERHGYNSRAISPLWVNTWLLSDTDKSALQTPHAITLLRWHLVFSTYNRQGVFSQKAGQAIDDCWNKRCSEWRIKLQKISVVPDHIHVAIGSHPTVVPAELIVSMLNASQELIQERYDFLLIEAKIPQLWKPSAYVGSYGDLTKEHIRNYLRDWEHGRLT